MKFLKKFNEMIVIKDQENKAQENKSTPYYELSYNYMIGDGDGNTSKIVKVSKDNPYLERYVKLLNSLKPTKGNWGVILKDDRLYKCFAEGQITEDDYNFLSVLMFEEPDIDEEDIKKLNLDEKYRYQFSNGVEFETEYSFLVFKGIKLIYVDEYNVRYNAEIND